MYNCHDTVVAPSGLAALIVPFFAFLKQGDEVLIMIQFIVQQELFVRHF